MLIREQEKFDRCGKKRKYVLCTLKCDNCEKIFDRLKSQFHGVTHHCSDNCRVSALKKKGAIHNVLEKNNIDKYGVKSTLQRPEVRKKIFESWIKNGKQTCSTRELLLRSILNHAFPTYVITYQKLIRMNEKIHPVDFYIDDLKLFIEFDGKFHHGLFTKDWRYAGVFSKVKNDLTQNAWFESNKVTLIRILETKFDSICDVKPNHLTKVDDNFVRDAAIQFKCFIENALKSLNDSNVFVYTWEFETGNCVPFVVLQQKNHNLISSFANEQHVK